MILQELVLDKEKYLNRIKNEWLNVNDCFPDFLIAVDKATKLQNEDYLQSISSQLQKQIKSFPRLPFRRKHWRNKSLRLINNLLYEEEIIAIHHYMKPFELDEFSTELMQFMKTARSFAPELSISDLGQALRNYIVYAMFKKIHNENSGFHRAAFGYSMLYPFTDNYIDNISLTSDDKKEYNQIIRDKLQGKVVYPKTVHERKTCLLLDDIASLYPLGQDNTVYQLLIMMLDAQEKSLHQQNKHTPLTPEERLDISVYKGGLSVLMDRFFVAKEVTEKDLNFYLGFGFFLQLADDLQDIGDDSNSGYSTLFTLDLNPEQEEKIVNRILNYVHNLMEEYQTENNSFKYFLLNNCYLLIISSVIRSRKFFTEDYVKKLEAYYPVNSSFMDNIIDSRIDNKDAKKSSEYQKIVDELIQ